MLLRMYQSNNAVLGTDVANAGLLRAWNGDSLKAKKSEEIKRAHYCTYSICTVERSFTVYIL